MSTLPLRTMRGLRERCKECSGTGWKPGAIGVIQCRHDALRREQMPAKSMPLFMAGVPAACQTDALADIVEQTITAYPNVAHQASSRVVTQGIRLVKGARHGR